MDTSAILGLSIGIPLAIIAGLVIGYIVAMRIFKRQLKKNPPISEAQIRMMYAQMGRKPSESQVKQIMNSVKRSD